MTEIAESIVTADAMSDAMKLFMEALNPANARTIRSRTLLLSKKTVMLEVRPLADLFKQRALSVIDASAGVQLGGPSSTAFLTAYKVVCRSWLEMFKGSNSTFKVMALALAANDLIMEAHATALDRAIATLWTAAQKRALGDKMVGCGSDATVTFARAANGTMCFVQDTALDGRMPCNILPGNLPVLSGLDTVLGRGGRRRRSRSVRHARTGPVGR